MNFELKKVSWDADHLPDNPQTVSVSFRKKNAPDISDSYTLVADSLYVLSNGTVVNPPLIKGLANATVYVFRLTATNGNILDVEYITPEEVKFDKLSNQYTVNSRVECTISIEETKYDNWDFYYAHAPRDAYAFYSLENHFSDMKGISSDIRTNGLVVPRKEDLFTGMYIDSQTAAIVAPDLNMNLLFNSENQTGYAWGVYFYAASADLPATGSWPLLSCVDENGHGVIVYVDNATKQIVWQHKGDTLTESVRSTDPIVMDSWNSILVGNFTPWTTGQQGTYMFLNGNSQVTTPITMSSLPDTISTTALLHVGHVEYGMEAEGKGIFRNLYVNNSDWYNDDDRESNFINLKYPVGCLQKKNDPDAIINLSPDSLVFVSQYKLAFTIPKGTIVGQYNFYGDTGYKKTSPIDCQITNIYRAVNGFSLQLLANDENTHAITFPLHFYGLGGSETTEANGGLTPKNIYFKDGQLMLEAHGDCYNGEIRGVDNNAGFKKHTEVLDPLLDEDWRTRVGAAVTTKSYCGYGSYKVEAKLPKQLGVSPFFRLYHHAFVQATDPFYEECLASGLSRQGSVLEETGFYTKVRNEISMELPANDSVIAFNALSEIFSANYSTPYAGMKVAVIGDVADNTGTWQLNDPTAPQQASSWTKISAEVQRLFNPRRDQVKLTNARGTQGTGVGVSKDPITSPDEFMEMHAAIVKDIWDDEFHEFRIDWYANRVEYYIDGVLLATNSYCVPDIEGRFSFGLSFPSAPLSGKSWLPDPAQLSAGAAAWHHQTMVVRRVTFTAFNATEAGGLARSVGETYPYAGIYQLIS